MQQPVKDGRGDGWVAEDRTPLAIVLVPNRNDRASFATCAYEFEEDRGTEIVQRQVTHSGDDRSLRAI